MFMIIMLLCGPENERTLPHIGMARNEDVEHKLLRKVTSDVIRYGTVTKRQVRGQGGILFQAKLCQGEIVCFVIAQNARD